MATWTDLGKILGCEPGGDVLAAARRVVWERGEAVAEIDRLRAGHDASCIQCASGEAERDALKAERDALLAEKPSWAAAFRAIHRNHLREVAMRIYCSCIDAGAEWAWARAAEFLDAEPGVETTETIGCDSRTFTEQPTPRVWFGGTFWHAVAGIRSDGTCKMACGHVTKFERTQERGGEVNCQACIENTKDHPQPTPPLERVTAERDEYRTALRNLLARIFRDGGHHAAAVGDLLAAQQAEISVVAMLQTCDERDASLAQLAEAKAEIEAALRKLVDRVASSHLACMGDHHVYTPQISEAEVTTARAVLEKKP
jgi:hypothetical protein